MTQPDHIPSAGPTPAPSTSGHPAPTRRRWAISEWVSWGVILAIIALSVFSNRLKKQDPQEIRESEGSQVLMISRYVVGTQQWLKLAGAAGETQNQELVQQVEKLAKSPPDRLRAAIVKGEFQGTQEADTQIESLGQTYPSIRKDAETVRAIYNSQNPATAPGWPAFHTRYGWFAELAAAAGRPAGSPERAAAMGPATRTALTLLGVSLLALCAGLLGLVLMILAILFLVRGRITPRFNRIPPLPADRRTYLQGFALYMGGIAVFSLLLALVVRYLLPNLPMLLRESSLVAAFLVGAAWPFLRGQTWTQWRATTGLHAGRGFFREVGAGIVGYLAGFPIFLIGIFITGILVKISGSDASHPITEELSHGFPTWIAVLLLASAWAPFSEELMFRGMLFAHLRERFPWWSSAILMGIVFAIIHPQGWAAVPALASLAVVFAGIREWRGSILGCMTAHALHNGVTLVVATLLLT